MSEKWEVVGGGKKTKKVGNGVPKAQQPQQQSVTSSPKIQLINRSNGKVKKGRPKVSMDFKLKQKSEEFEVPVPGEEPPTAAKTQQKKAKTATASAAGSKTNVQGPKKAQDLESTLERVPVEELTGFFDNLRGGEVNDDVCLSWIRYTADVLNSRLSKVPTPDASQWPNDLSYPRMPGALQETIQRIIVTTVDSVKDVDKDVIGASYASLLASLPFLLQRGDPAWGYLLFLREIIRMEPDVVLRRSKSQAELMESFGNRREVGIACLWVSAQASLHSPSVLRIVMGQIVPFYNYKHFKAFVVSVLRTLGDTEEMTTSDILVEPDEFEDFFEASFDPKRRKDFERFYPRIKDLTLKNLHGQGKELFANFLTRVGDKDFAPFSVIGHEVLDILHGCLENDTSVIGYWAEVVGQFPRESAVLLNYLSKNVANLNCSKPLESQFIQTDAFAVAAVKNPELLRAAKKVQTGVQQREASRRRFFSWKMATYLLLLSIIGLLWLDIAENGKGSFSKSNVGKLLENYGLLDEALYVGDEATKLAKVGYEYAQPILRSIHEGVQPVLQAVDKQLQIYIPEVVRFVGILSEKTVEYFNFLTEKVFVGSLSPENLRKITKEVLTIVWTNLYFLATKLFDLAGLLVQTVQGYL